MLCRAGHSRICSLRSHFSFCTPDAWRPAFAAGNCDAGSAATAGRHGRQRWEGAAQGPPFARLGAVVGWTRH
eukprot:6250917-Pyramimonas_sp.AAC.1